MYLFLLGFDKSNPYILNLIFSIVYEYWLILEDIFFIKVSLGLNV